MDPHHKPVDLTEALLLLKTPDEVLRFLKDLCTPQELRDLGERWRVCQLLAQGNLSYREISAVTGASSATIGRVARFLREEQYQGYNLVLNRRPLAAEIPQKESKNS